jgi:hypothetical protein
MFTAFLVVLALALSGFALIGLIFCSRRFGWLGLGAFIGMIALVAISGLFWQHAVLAAAISSTVFLALGVMLQKVEPVKAILGALAAMVLFFVLTRLAVELAGIFFFEETGDVHNWIQESWGFTFSELGKYCPGPITQFGLGIACLVAAGLFDRTLKALLVFVGMLLLALQATHAFNQAQAIIEIYPELRDPLVQFCLVLLLAAFLFRLILASLDSGRVTKNVEEGAGRTAKNKKQGP